MTTDKKVIDQEGNEVLDPRKALSEQTLAVDLQRADFDQAIATAHKYPRILDSVVKQIETMACYNEEAAENCIYSLPRGGKPIIGPSIGFANILATAWGNCIDMGRPTYVDRKEKLAYGEGIFHDLQTNRRTVIHESRRISGKSGSLFSDDMIAVTGKAAAAVARRNAILNAVPRAIWHPIYEMALRIVRGDQETFAERKDKALKAFHQFGVKPEQIYMVLGLKGEIDLNLEHVPILRGMYQALREGSTTVEEMFDPRRMTGKAFDTVDNPLGDAAAEPADASMDDAEVVADADEAPVASSKTTATAVGPAAGAAGAPASEVAARAQPAQETARAAPAGGQAAPETKPAARETKPAEARAEAAEAKTPATVEEYMTAWAEFCRSATSESAIKNRRAADRNLRGRLHPTIEQIDEMDSIQNDRITELRR
jgi:hypothetical protein